jgi:hypothetical protein
MLSTGTTHRLWVCAVVLALAALLAPAALANREPADPDGQLDPWAYNVIYRAAPSVPLVTDNAAGQNRGEYGPLDPWAYNVIHRAAPSVPLVTDNSAAQNGGRQTIAAASTPTFDAGGFAWRDAGIGAGAALAAVLLAFGTARLVVRRTRVRPVGF